MPIEQSQFGQLRLKDGTGLTSYARSAFEDFVFVAEFVIGLDVFGDELVEFSDLALESLYHFVSTFEHLPMTNGLFSIQFWYSQVSKLMAPSNQVGQFVSLTAELCSGFGLKELCETGKNPERNS